MKQCLVVTIVICKNIKPKNVHLLKVLLSLKSLPHADCCKYQQHFSPIFGHICFTNSATSSSKKRKVLSTGLPAA